MDDILWYLHCCMEEEHLNHVLFRNETMLEEMFGCSKVIWMSSCV